MEDTYTIMRVFAGSWGMMFMLLSFLGVVLFTLRPGSRSVHRDTANIPFRYDDKPASDTDYDSRRNDAHLKEARQ